jgi:hypothetical protein
MQLKGYELNEVKALEPALKRTLAVVMGVHVDSISLAYEVEVARLRTRNLGDDSVTKVTVTLTDIEGADKQADCKEAQQKLKTDSTEKTRFGDIFTTEVRADDPTATVPAAFALQTVGDAATIVMTEAPTSFPTGVPTIAPTHEEACPFGQFMGVCLIWLGALGGVIMALLFCFCCCMMRRRSRKRRMRNQSEWIDASKAVDSKFDASSRPSVDMGDRIDRTMSQQDMDRAAI